MHHLADGLKAGAKGEAIFKAIQGAFEAVAHRGGSVKRRDASVIQSKPITLLLLLLLLLATHILR